MKIWDTSSWRNKKSKYYVIALSAFMLIVLSVLSISIGRVSISFRSVIDFFLGRDVSSSTWHVIYNLRLPRLIGAVFAGAALSVSGLIFQNIFQNPLVSSDLLGVASGSCAGAAFAIVLGLSSIYVAGFSFLVGIVSVILCILLSEIIKRRNNLILVFAGIIIGKFMDSVVGFLKYFADPESQLGDIVNWQLGTISKVNINKSKIMMIVIGICLIIAFLFRWRVNLLSVGEKDAFSLGVNTKVDRMILIILSTVLTATSVCFCGTISWVGLIIPHISRLIIGSDNRYAMPFCTILGSSFLVLADMVARSATDYELPLGVITGICGAPIFAIILIRKAGSIHEW